MPILKNSTFKEITLPISGAKVKLGLSYGDSLAITRVMTSGMKIGAGKDAEIDASVLDKQTQEMMTRGIKGWDFTDEKGEPLPIEMQYIEMLDNEDGKAIDEALRDLLGYNVKNKEEEEEFQKK